MRGAVLVALTIPFSLLWAFVLMRYTNIPANLLSLGAIDFGIIVDGAIVLLEVILRRHERNPGQPLTESNALDAALEVAKPMFFATLVIITAYLPLFAFERVEKKLFTPMAFTVGYSLLGALLFAQGAIPALAYLTYRKPGKTWHNPVFEWLRLRYDALLLRIIARPRIALLPGLAAGLVALILGMTIGREFLPYLDEGSMWIQINLPAGDFDSESHRDGTRFPPSPAHVSRGVLCGHANRAGRCRSGPVVVLTYRVLRRIEALRGVGRRQAGPHRAHGTEARRRIARHESWFFAADIRHGQRHGRRSALRSRRQDLRG